MTDTKRLEELLEAIRLAVYLRPSNFEDARTTYEYIEKHIRTLLEEKDMNYLKIIVEKETHIIDLEAELEKYKKIVEAARIAMTNFHPLKESPFNALNDALKKRSRDD